MCDKTTFDGSLTYEELSGKKFSKAQFLAEREAIHDGSQGNITNRATMQESGDKYVLAVALMPRSKKHTYSPAKKDPNLTKQQVRRLALQTFRTVYNSTE